MANFLDSAGVTHLWGHIKQNFDNKIDSIKIDQSLAYVSGKTLDLRVKMNGSEVPFTAGTSSRSANTLDLGTVITAETQLSRSATTGTLGSTVVTDVTVSGHKVTVEKSSIGDAAKKGVVTGISASNSGSTDLPTTSAVTNYIESQLTAALKYKGTVDSGHTLPASHKQGDVYVVASAGTYAGKACEVGDYIICNTTGTVAKNEDWDVVNGENQVDNKGATLATGQTITIATVDGTDITIVVPSWAGVSKTGTVTSITPGAGLVNGSSAKTAITSSGTLMANLKDYTANTADSSKSTSTDGGLYSVELDKSGKLAVRVPWTDTVYTHPGKTTGNTTGSTTLAHGDSFSAITAVTIDASGHTSQIKTQKFTLPAGYVHPSVTTTNTTTAETLSHGGAFSAITTVEVNASGHVTGYTTKTYTLPSDNDTWRDIKVNNAAWLTGKDAKALNVVSGTGISLTTTTAGTLTITNTAPFPGHATHSLTVTNGTASAASQGTEITYVESVSGCTATSGGLTASTVRKKITIPVTDTALSNEQIDAAILAADANAIVTH